MTESVTEIPGIKVGHYTDLKHATGCTVILFEKGAVAGVDVRGASPGTRETDLLRPGNLIEKIHGIVLSGGSAYGLDTASGVMQYLEEQGLGFQVGPAIVPIVPAAIIFDLGLSTHLVRPTAKNAYEACKKASSDTVPEGSLGAGTGATLGKLLGMKRAVKGGVGTICLDLGNGLLVGAIMVVNAAGGLIDPETGNTIAGPLQENRKGFLDTVSLMTKPGFQEVQKETPVNTTIGVVITNATLTKEQANRLAMVSQDGIAMTIRPSHTMVDGDVIFAAGTGEKTQPLDHNEYNRLGIAATQAVAKAIVRAVTEATTVGTVPCVSEIENA